ncbi:hypothetical protein D4764_04G0015840 [Takifugu flavidus]|uniref:Uncharacterized protein n=1 Tax=Takifugu flavidus TaxID=433684 RepID=A0A5C6NBA6_9TELE|nr:hypothetical protein D4764_04G0015840 [Takifugu flavidus]
MSAQHAEQFAFFPGKLWVVFRKGPLGFLLQEPSDEAKRRGDPSDKMEVQGDYVLQFGKYKGKSFRWLLQNDVGSTVYLIKNVQSEEAAVSKEIQALLTYEAGRGDGVTASSEDDQLVGFGARAKSRQALRSRHTNVQVAAEPAEEAAAPTSSTPAEHPMKAPAEPWLNMQKQFAFFPGKLQVVFRKGPLGFLLQEPSDEAKRNDAGSTVYLIKNVQSEEAAGLCMADSHSKDSLQSFVSYALSFQEIQALLTYEAGRGDGVTASSEDDQLVGFGARAKSRWKEIWDSRGDGYADFVTGRRCVPGTRMSRLQQNLLKRQQPTTSSTPAEYPMKAPAEPLPELLDMVAELPSPNFFQLHPFFIWKPESHITVRLRNNDILPCLHSCPRPQVVSAGVGRPPVIVSVRGQYLIFSSRLCCKACRRNWSADTPPWVEKLPVRFTNLLPAFLTYKKLLQGTLGQVFRWDHTRKMARKVTLASGAMSSLAVMNENWLIVSWVMVQAETERSLHPM